MLSEYISHGGITRQLGSCWSAQRRRIYGGKVGIVDVIYMYRSSNVQVQVRIGTRYSLK